MPATLTSARKYPTHQCPRRRPVGLPLAAASLLLLTLPLLAGCGKVAAESRQARETWDAIYLQGKKVGHA
ncbi:MAG TPA: hypothetical protein VIK18_01455, partial [Pirellulales bacterium]